MPGIVSVQTGKTLEVKFCSTLGGSKGLDGRKRKKREISKDGRWYVVKELPLLLRNLFMDFEDVFFGSRRLLLTLIKFCKEEYFLKINSEYIKKEKYSILR